MAGDAFITSQTFADDLHMKLLYLENRVAFARLVLPAEAKLAMAIAHTETTDEFSGIAASKGLSGNLREVDLNETPVMQNRRLRSRMETLMKTDKRTKERKTSKILGVTESNCLRIKNVDPVQACMYHIFHCYGCSCLNCVVVMITVKIGRRYFPHCSEVLDKFLEDDLPDLFYLEKGTHYEQQVKRTRFMELKEEVQKAFSKDKAERFGLSSSSSSSCLKDGGKYELSKL